MAVVKRKLASVMGIRGAAPSRMAVVWSAVEPPFQSGGTSEGVPGPSPGMRQAWES